MCRQAKVVQYSTVRAAAGPSWFAQHVQAVSVLLLAVLFVHSPSEMAGATRQGQEAERASMPGMVQMVQPAGRNA